MTDKIIPGEKYYFSEPFRTRAEELMNGIGLPDRSKWVEHGYKPIPPTEKQLRYLERLGHTGAAPKNLWECTKLIDKLLNK
jgi:hypothetical protein